MTPVEGPPGPGLRRSIEYHRRGGFSSAPPYQSCTRWPSTGNQITSTTPESTTATT